MDPVVGVNDRHTYRSAFGTHENWMTVSKPGECTAISTAEVKKRLNNISNAFADVPEISPGNFNICLPPNSSMEIKPDHITITTSVCEIAFAVQMLSNMSNYPGNYTAPPMFQGAPRYSTTDFGIRVTTTYFALRAQDRLIDKYKSWTTSVVSRARIWLEGPAAVS